MTKRGAVLDDDDDDDVVFVVVDDDDDDDDAVAFPWVDEAESAESFAAEAAKPAFCASAGFVSGGGSRRRLGRPTGAAGL